MRKTARLCALLLLFASPAAADFNTRSFALASDLELRVRDDYPRPSETFAAPATIGVTLDNSGPERRVELALHTDTELKRSVRVPAHERVQLFLYVPARGWPVQTLGSLNVVDTATGAERTVDVGASVSSERTLARLGTISSALNVDAPWHLIGALDAHVPDHWRGLASVTGIVVEHRTLAAQSEHWPVLRDWVVMGGLLVVASTREELAEALPFETSLPFSEEITETEAGLMQQVGLGAIARVYPERLAHIGEHFVSELQLPTIGFSLKRSDLNPHELANAASARLAQVVTRHAGALFALLSLFVLVVGPFGYTLFVRKTDQPLRYVAFAAGTAASFSVAVIAADMLGNGVHTKGAVRSLLMIDQRNDRELGLEDAVLYEPTGFGYDLMPLAHAQLLLPLHDPRESSDGLVLEEAGKRVRVRNTVPPRQARWLGARWLGEASGRLVVAAVSGETLEIENQLGRDLQTLLIWHEGIPYTHGPLARGRRGLAQRHEDAPRLTQPESPIMSAASKLYNAISYGEIGPNRYLAKARWTVTLSSLLQNPLELRPTPELVIAGVY